MENQQKKKHPLVYKKNNLFARKTDTKSDGNSTGSKQFLKVGKIDKNSTRAQ